MAQVPTFAPVTTYSSGGSTPFSLAAADINSDGKLDIIIANTYNSLLGVLLGNGNGTFQPVTTYSTGLGTSPRNVLIVDINGDTKLDLVFASISGSGVLGAVLGNGNGTFQAPVFYPSAGLHTPDYVATGDLNGDGKLDVVSGSFNTTGNTGNVQVLLGNGNGTFQAPRLYASGSIYYLVMADVNKDGKLDVLTANFYGSTAGVLLGNGDGTLQAEAAYSTGSGSTPYALAAADVNADGHLDLLTANYGSRTAGVLLGNGDGTFQPLATYSAGARSTPAGIVAADVNADGQLDLLTANFNDNSAGVLLGNGNGTFRAPLLLSTDTTPNQQSAPFSVIAADVNRDGRLDLLTANYNDNSVGVLLQTSPLAAHPAQFNSQMTLAPNPASDYATLHLNGLAPAALVHVTWFDTTGRVVYFQALAVAQAEAQLDWSKSKLAPGMYVLQVQALDAGGRVISTLLGQRLTVQ